jgi:4-hydroxy 2-oxovalerate aldolase
MINYLDCTLRDGGYYNDWKFDKAFVKKYLKAVSSSNKIQYVEIGLKDTSLPNWGNVSNDILNELREENTNLKIGTMSFMKDGIETLYTDSTTQDFVRIGIKPSEIKKGINVLKYLKDKGYFVSLNLTHVTPSLDTSVFDVLSRHHDEYDVLYVADTYGTMTISDIINFQHVKVNKIGIDKPLGFHGHNNNYLAYDNSLEAIKYGYKWIDGTFMGFGRGAGNTELERLLDHPDVYKISVMFYDLYKQYNWGPNVFYSYASKYNIHPTYVQNLLQTDLTSDNLFLALTRLSEHPERLLFNKTILNSFLKG